MNSFSMTIYVTQYFVAVVESTLGVTSPTLLLMVSPIRPAPVMLIFPSWLALLSFIWICSSKFSLHRCPIGPLVSLPSPPLPSAISHCCVTPPCLHPLAFGLLVIGVLPAPLPTIKPCTLVCSGFFVPGSLKCGCSLSLESSDLINSLEFYTKNPSHLFISGDTGGFGCEWLLESTCRVGVCACVALPG